ncbi:ATP-binding protein [Streptomyces syringium]|uniref:Anti-sigma regulatory factor (Ser/Thr protein kinase) n=1 Tax=Streptomyces syringium TaxID=76729 RepID=A0ABS4Y1V4_9ACTN|nr:ATP-binding protein [Streptomyces syringium]MBP2402759.1 anti-sigma regulatory factor (Ser/Thr protein kinase) [Streptomyces syringium]
MLAPEELPSPLQYDRMNYPSSLQCVTIARRHIARLVDVWGYPEAADDAAALLSELAGNAVQHGRLRGRLFQVELTVTQAVTRAEAVTLRIAVSDARGETLPRPRHATPEDEFGRGLLIIRTLATRWGVARRTVGKTVWCELDLGGCG